jgi:hypothetical protein
MTKAQIVIEKLSPAKVRLSPRMRWIVDSLTGQDYGARGPRGEAPGHISITSDGFLTHESMFLGSWDDLNRNLVGLLVDTLHLTKLELRAFWALYQQHVTDFRL